MFDTQPTPIEPGAVSADSGLKMRAPEQLASAYVAPGHAWLHVASRKWRWGVPAILLLFVTLAFMPALTADFSYWDDDDLVIFNSEHLNFSAQNLKWMFTTTHTGHYQPLTWLTYALDYQLWWKEAFGYHLTNVLFHLAATLTFYFVVRKLLAVGLGLHSKKHSKAVLVSAMLAAVVFAIHPLRVESVAWIAERRDVVSGFLFILAVAFYLRYVMQKKEHVVAVQAFTGQTVAGLETSPSYSYRWSYVAVILCCTLSLFAKASAVMLPHVLLVLDVYPLRRLKLNKEMFRGSSRWVIIEKLPLFVLSTLGMVQAIWAQHKVGAMYPLSEYDIPSRVAQACYGVVFYLRKTLWPANLGPLYEIPTGGELFGPMLWLSLLALLIIVGVTIFWRKYWPALIAAMLTYLFQIAPLLGFFQSGPQLVADRYSYLSCLGFAVLAGVLLLQALRSSVLSGTHNRRSMIALVSVVIVALMYRATDVQGRYWQTPIDLWSRGVQVSPDSSVANVNYADALAMIGDDESAIQYYLRGLQIQPQDVIALRHLAQVYARTGNGIEAMRLYGQVLSLDPSRSQDYLNFAHLQINHDHPDQAVALLRERLQHEPGDLETTSYLAELLATHPDAKIRNGVEAVRLARLVSDAHRGMHSPSLFTLSTALAEAGQYVEAIRIAEKAIIIADRELNDRLIDELRRRITMFHQSRPYHYGD